MTDNTTYNENNPLLNRVDIVYRVKYYANTPEGERNKLFCWSINLFDLENHILRTLIRGYYIKSAWLEAIYEGRKVSNKKIDLSPIREKLDNMSIEERLQLVS